MSEIFREIDEELRRDRLEQVWNRYGGYIIGIALAAVLGTAAFVGWREWQLSRNAEATAKLVAAVEAKAQSAGAQADAQAFASLTEELPTGPALLARFQQAGLLAKSGDVAGAAKVYDAVAADTGVEQPYRDLATILSVSHQLDTGDAAALAQRLEALSVDESPWRFSARELMALLAAKGGDREKAAKLLEALSTDEAAPASIRSRAADLATLYGAKP